jgi:hypothetical protein
MDTNEMNLHRMLAQKDAEIERLMKDNARLRGMADEFKALVQRVDEQEAEIERLMDVYKAARGLCYGHDWNKGSAAISNGYRRKLIAAVNAIEPLPAALAKEEK